MLQELNVISALGRILALKKDVGVRVDETGQDCDLRSKVDHRCTGRRLAALADAFNLVSANRDQDVVPHLGGDAVDEVGGADQRDFFRSGRCGLAEARAEQARENGRQNGSAAYHVAIPPVSERDYEYANSRDSASHSMSITDLSGHDAP